MAKWRKRFAMWAQAKAPISTDEVEPILRRVFGDRLKEHAGTSHRWTIDVPELMGVHRDYQFGQISLPVKGGQTVKAAYLQIAFDAAERLGLPEDEGQGEDE